jgi:hypothetical protein
MRVAASILLLITTAFVTLRLLETEPEQMASFKAAKPQLIPAVTHRSAPANADAPRPQPQPLGEEVRLDIAQEIAVPTASVPALRPAAMPVAVESRPVDLEADQARDNEKHPDLGEGSPGDHGKYRRRDGRSCRTRAGRRNGAGYAAAGA